MVTNPQLQENREEEQSTPNALPLLSTSKGRTLRRHIINKLANYVVSLGGFLLIVSVVAIIVVMMIEIVPLFRPSYVSFEHTIPGVKLASPPRVLGTDEYLALGYAIQSDGTVHFFNTTSGEEAGIENVAGLDGASLSSVFSFGGGRYVLGTSDGRAIPLDVRFSHEFTENGRVSTPALELGEVRRLVSDASPILNLTAVYVSERPIIVGQVAPRELFLYAIKKSKSLVASGGSETIQTSLRVESEGAISALTIDSRSEYLFVGTSHGELIAYSLADLNEPKEFQRSVVNPAAVVNVERLQFLLGERTLIVTDSSGGVTSWMFVRKGTTNQQELKHIYTFAKHDAPVSFVAPSLRSRTFFTADRTGLLQMHYGTTGDTLLKKALTSGVTALGVGARGDGAIVADANGSVRVLGIHNPHPEISLSSLFSRIWYEGYNAPAYVWQSTGGTDDFEPKFGLPPLIFGTLKGTFYAMLLAVPLAVLGALYVSQFMHPTMRAIIKPSVELMAALPSVVVGFIAGLWLAPRLEPVILGVLLSPIVLPIIIIAALYFLRTFGGRLISALPSGMEILVLIPVVIFGLYMSFQIGWLVEDLLFGGDLASWLFSTFGVVFDQRNSVVVGIAMGFAVIPIIFTISEDSLASVPTPLSAASLALGASKWTTALKVVLPAALPGIFSAIMIGFGRAVGETMIVLMATGNTPLFDLTPFNGFRALSANIAVELPEAPEGGSLFRVLFFSALLLFAMTFVVNTVTELIRLRLRSRYRNL